MLGFCKSGHILYSLQNTCTDLKSVPVVILAISCISDFEFAKLRLTVKSHYKVGTFNIIIMTITLFNCFYGNQSLHHTMSNRSVLSE